MKEQDLEEIIDELVEAFVEDAPIRLDALHTAVESAAANSIASAAHAYKSAALTMRATRLADVLQRTEAAARNGDVACPAELFPQVRMEHEAVLSQLLQT